MATKDWLSLDTVGKKILLPTILYLVVLFGILGAVLIRNTATSIHDVGSSKGETMANFLEKIGTVYLNYFDIAALEGFIKEAQRDEELVFAAYFDPQGKRLTSGAAEPADTTGLTSFERVINNDAGQVLGSLRLAYSGDKVSKSITRGVLTVVVGVSLAVILFVLGMSWLIRNITGTLRMLTVAAENLSDGNVGYEIKADARNDEVGILQQNLRSMTENLRGLLRNLVDGVSNLSTSTTQIATTAKQSAATAAEQATTVAEVGTTIEEIHQTSKVTNDSAREVVRTSEAAVEKGSQGVREVAHTVSVIDDIARKIESLANKIVELNERNEEIGQIVDTVNDLTEQSNLLAVNASIEGAKAGEQGRGFAVVATEVRNLAKQSKKATLQIREIVKNVQEASEGAIMMAEECTKSAVSGRQAVESVRSFMQELSVALTENVDRATRIAAAANQQSAGISQIAEAMDAVKKGGEDTAAGAMQLEGSVDNLTELTRQIEGAVARFRGI